jgi:hypothetical protein
VLTALALYFVVAPLAAGGAVATVFAGTALFPILLPWLPTREFSSKGLILGGSVALPFAVAAFMGMETDLWQRIGWSLAYLLAMPPVTAFLALNFTGSTTFTSKTGVEREMFTYIRVMAGMFGGGIILTLILKLLRWIR